VKITITILLTLSLVAVLIACNSTTEQSSSVSEQPSSVPVRSSSVAEQSAITVIENEAIVPISLDRTDFTELINRHTGEDNLGDWALGRDRTVNLYYDDPMTPVTAPIILESDMNTVGYDFFVTKELTAIVFGALEPSEPVTIMISTDMGQSWETVEILFDEGGTTFRTKWIDFINEKDGYLCLNAYDDGYGIIYMTTDGGLTWQETGRYELPQNRGVMGITFVTRERFFISAWEGLTPLLFQSDDSGLSWTQREVQIPDELFYDRGAFFDKTIFENEKGILPLILLFQQENAQRVYFGTTDYGSTWIFLGE
jgi:hypothetical protein